jgi:hypothetical protein
MSPLFPDGMVLQDTASADEPTLRQGLFIWLWQAEPYQPR